MPNHEQISNPSNQGDRLATFPIVGIGASAGGIEALSALLVALPTDTGMGFVIIQHLSPEHASSLAQILSRTTPMPVGEVSDEPKVKPNHVYVIPPGRDMIISEGKLRLLQQERAARHHGIDQFFRSLAEDSGHLAIGVVLSGGASDGTLGIEEIKAAGGITFAQDESAQHESMPQSAAASGCVDFILPPKQIAEELVRIARHPHVAGEDGQPSGQTGAEHARIAQLVRRATGVDFTHYKASTLHRRITRRMMLHKLETLGQYEEHLRKSAGEAEALYQDVLINVTSFFRDPDAFDILAKKVFPAMLAGRSPHDAVRIWSLGCSTGEEAYSIAMVFTECAEALGNEARLQLFATDLNAAGIEKARAGLYPRSIATDVSPEWLRRFFTEEQGGYRIAKSIRERCVFSRHNSIADPPFSRMDFISCRNLLIYLEPLLQQQLLRLLHFALKAEGRLWLGNSESVGTASAFFECEDVRHKLFVRKPGPPTAGRAADTRLATTGPIFSPPLPARRETVQAELQRDAERLLLARYTPPGVIISAEMEILQFRGETGEYLAPAAGAASLHLFKMLRQGLLVGVRSAIIRAGKEGQAVREEGLRVNSSEGFRELAVEVIPIKGGPSKEGGFIVLFDEGAHSQRYQPPAAPPVAEEDRSDEITRLSHELTATRDYLQSVIEQQEAANDELQSANEEAQSANEELQSLNEELETSKEEIQSASEELATVNDELNTRNLELDRLTNDLTNILISARMPMLIVGRDLQIRRFTPAAEKTLGLCAADIDRPLTDTKMSIVISGLAPLLREVIDSVSPREREVQDQQGRWFSLRARPYQTQDNRIDGAVVTLVDIDDQHRARNYANDLLAHAPVPVLVMDSQLRVKTASRAFYDTFKVSPTATLGQFIYELGNRQWDIPALRRLLEEMFARAEELKDLEVRHVFEEIGPRIMILNGRHLAQTEAVEPLLVLSIEDITERARSEQAMSRLASIVASSEDAIISKDLNGIITSWNASAERMFGYTAGEMIGQPITVFIPSDRIEEEAEIIGHIRRGEPVNNFETVRRRKDGTLLDVSLTVSPIMDHRGRVVGASKIARDFTERRKLEAALVARTRDLARADRSKDEFLAMLAHELRNPLAPLQNAAEILQTPDASVQEREQAQQVIVRQLENMNRMIDDLLDIARITQGKIELRKQPVTLEAILAAATSLMRSRFAAHRQELTVSLPVEPVFLDADATRLEQVFGNLLSNAWKYSGEGAHIVLSAECSVGVEPPEVVVRVRDDGPGIDPEMLPHVFDLFVQGSRASDRAQGGLGIGLTLVQRLVTLHGGGVEARSEGLGRGSEFIVRLPVLREARPPGPGEGVRRSPRETSRRILIVDDHADSARTLAVIQSRRGHVVRTAFSGPEAVALAAAFQPEVVLLDIGLPGMDGFEVARRIREMPGLGGAFLVALSGYAGDEDRATAKAAGFDEYMVKPANCARLRDWLQLRT